MVTALLGKKSSNEWTIQAADQHSEVLILQTHIEMLLIEKPYCLLQHAHFHASLRWEQFTGLKTQASSPPDIISAGWSYTSGRAVLPWGHGKSLWH